MPLVGLAAVGTVLLSTAAGFGLSIGFGVKFNTLIPVLSFVLVRMRLHYPHGSKPQWRVVSHPYGVKLYQYLHCGLSFFAATSPYCLLPHLCRPLRAYLPCFAHLCMRTQLQLGIGVDDAFVLVSAYMDQDPSQSIPIRISRTLRQAGATVTRIDLHDVYLN